MKIKTLLLTISSFVMILSMTSCKKDSNKSSDNGPIKVKYEITSTLPFSTDPDYALLKSVGYTNATYNVEVISDLSGKTWSKEVLIQEIKKDYPITVFGTVVLNGVTGTVNTKISINGVVKSETNQIVQKISDELSTVVINANYTF